MSTKNTKRVTVGENVVIYQRGEGNWCNKIATSFSVKKMLQNLTPSFVTEHGLLLHVVPKFPLWLK